MALQTEPQGKLTLYYLLTADNCLLLITRSVLEAASRLVKRVDLSLSPTSYTTKRLTY
jgi:hypothetical protein